MMPWVIIPLLLIILNFFLGAWHGSLIRRMEQETIETGSQKTKIKHGWWAFAYAGVICLLAWPYGIRYDHGFSWWFVIDGLLIRELVFDPTLNKFRKLKFFHISPEVIAIKNLKEALSKGKTIDWIQFRAFGKDLWVLYIICLTACIYITGWKL